MSQRLAKEIAEMLDAAGIGVYSTSDPTLRTIFTGKFPSTVADGINVVESLGPPPHEYIDHEYPVLDFWSRSDDADRAHTLLEQVQGLFHRRNGYSTTNWYIYNSAALGAIVDVDEDREAGKLYRLSIQFICRNLNNVS
jgi:hypothetical protein